MSGIIIQDIVKDSTEEWNSGGNTNSSRKEHTIIYTILKLIPLEPSITLFVNISILVVTLCVTWKMITAFKKQSDTSPPRPFGEKKSIEICEKEQATCSEKEFFQRDRSILREINSAHPHSIQKIPQSSHSKEEDYSRFDHEWEE